MIRLLLAAALLGNVLAQSSLTMEQQHGREIYRRGKVAGLAVGTAAIGADGIPLQASSFACASCHGTWGDGSRESGIEPPPLRWKRLTAPAVSSVTGRRRGAYTRDALRRAITAGVDPSGARLYSGMPRYDMPNERLTELLAYLERLGDDDDTDPGVTSSTIRIGAALPLSGPLEPAGRSIRETLELLFAEASRKGGIYGRSIELVVEDSQGTPSGLLDATHHLIASDQVFAMTASFQMTGSQETVRLLETAEVPLVGPVALSPHEKGLPNPFIFYLLPSLYDQARALIDFIAARDTLKRPRLAVIYAGTSFDQDVVDGLRNEASVQGLEMISAERDAPDAVPAVIARHPDYLVFSGDGAGLVRIAKEVDQVSPGTVLAGFISTAQSGVRLLPPRVAARALLVAPTLPPAPDKAREFFSLLRAGHSPKNYLGLRTSAFAAGNLLVQALRLSGSRPDRDGLAHTLEHLQHFETGVMAPLAFGPNRRVGTAGAVILALDPADGDFVAVSDWISPKL